MSERHGIREVAGEVKKAIGRLLANTRVVEFPLDIDSEIKKYSDEITPVVHEGGCVVEPVLGELEAVIEARSTSRDAVIEPEMTKVTVDMVPVHAHECPVIEENPQPKSVPTGFDRTGSKKMEGFVELGVIPNRLNLDKFTAVKTVSVDNVDLTKVKILTESADLTAFTRNGIITIRKYPIIIGPTPWNVLDKKLLVKAWDRLKAHATAKLGHDPGKNLEMAAIYADVDFSIVQKAIYDKGTRNLRLVLREPEIGRPVKRNNYAIIIGVLRRTGKVLQVAMKLGGR